MQRLSEAPPLVLILGFGGLLPFLAGAITWAGFDYRGESTP